MFNIYDKEGEPILEDVKILLLFDRTQHASLQVQVEALKANITTGTPVTYTNAANHLTTAVYQIAEYVAKSRVAGATGTRTGNTGITDSDGNSINVDSWILNWNQLSKGDRDNILPGRRNKGVKLWKGGNGGSNTSGENKALKTLRKQNKKFKRQIKALKRIDGGKGDNSGDEDYKNDPSDAGNAFGGGTTKKAKKKVLLIGRWCMLFICSCIKLKYLVIKLLKHIINLTTTTQTRICAFTSGAWKVSSSTGTSS